MFTQYTFSDFNALCACQAMRQSARKISRRYDAALRPLDLNIGQFTILASLMRPDPVTITVLAKQLGMDRTTLTRDLKPLDRRGFIMSQSGAEDARQRHVGLSDLGRELLASAIPLWEEAQKRTKKDMSDGQWNDLRKKLQTLTE